MKWVLDTCVLYPTVMREMLLGVAGAGGFEPIWSDRILEEWARASDKLGPLGRVQAEGEIALVKRDWPSALRTWPSDLEARLWLPDPADVHVMALGLAHAARGIVTLNLRDFPRDVLAENGLERCAPDAFLWGIWAEQPAMVERVAQQVLEQARRIGSEDWELRALLKKARLPRLAKALTQPSKRAT